MIIPFYTNCPICDEPLDYSTFYNYNHCEVINDHSFMYGNDSEWDKCPWIEITYHNPNITISLEASNSWILYDNETGGPDRVASGNNADELFNLDDINAIKETALTLFLYA